MSDKPKPKPSRKPKPKAFEPKNNELAEALQWLMQGKW